MKILLLFLLAFALYSCSNSPTDSNNNNQNQTTETLVLDRSGITDSVYSTSGSGWQPFLTQNINFPYDTIRITFQYSGSLNGASNTDFISASISSGNLFLFGTLKNLFPSYQSIDTTYRTSSFNEDVSFAMYKFSMNSWITVKDLKIYGR